LAPSDVVQESLLEAARDFRGFRGTSEAELLGWLRRMLQHNLANARRRHLGAAMRSAAREVPFTEAPAAELERRIRDAGDTPSTDAQKRERDEALEGALGQLPERYRQVLLLHTTEQLSFVEVGTRLGISADAARKLWAATSRVSLLLPTAAALRSAPIGQRLSMRCRAARGCANGRRVMSSPCGRWPGREMIRSSRAAWTNTSACIARKRNQGRSCSSTRTSTRSSALPPAQ
jgi:RNA polymerase sigma-70 factor (subfamily 1)